MFGFKWDLILPSVAASYARLSFPESPRSVIKQDFQTLFTTEKKHSLLVVDHCMTVLVL